MGQHKMVQSRILHHLQATAIKIDVKCVFTVPCVRDMVLSVHSNTI